MHNSIKQKICYYLFMLLMLITIDCIISAVVFKQFFVTYPLLEIAIIMVILSPIFLVKTNKFAVIYYSLLFGVFIIIMVISLLLNYASGDIFSIKYLFLFGEAAQVMSMQFVNFFYIFLAIFLVLIYILYFVLIYRIFKFHVYTNPKKKYIYYPIGIPLTLVLIGLGFLFRFIGTNQVKHDYKGNELYKDMSANEILETSASSLKRGAIRNFGMLTYLESEIAYSIPKSSDKKMVKDFFDEGKIVNDEIYDSYSGICTGKNVIEIMIETGNDYFINEELTPNLYRLKNEGIDFTKNYSKNKTNISEIIGFNGSVAEVGTTKDYNVKFSLPNILKEEGYKTSYFHNNSKTFYDRLKLNKSAGFDNLYFKEDIDPKQSHNFLNGNYPLDAYFMNGLKSGNMSALSAHMEDIDGIIDDIIPEEGKFYSYWTTMSTHGPYNTSKRNLNYYLELGYLQKITAAEALGKWENVCKDDNANIQAQVVNLQAEFMDLDLALGCMIDRLEELGIFDDTLFILYGDHEPYYMSNGEKQLKFAMYDTDDAKNPTLYQTTFIMYNTDLNQTYEANTMSTTFDEFTSPYNIVPTTLDLLGIKYNENHYVGKSVFLVENEMENMFYSHELECLFNDKVYIDDYQSYKYKADDLPDIDDNDYLFVFDEYSVKTLKRIQIFNKFYDKKLYDLVERD